MKTEICAVIGAVGGAIAAAFGGWSAGLTTLVVFMAADYLTGLLVAGVFHASKKTPHGGLESKAGWKGLARKSVTLLLVLAACRLEGLLGVTYIRDAAVVGFCANEALSVAENAVLMGVVMPRPLADALEVLRQKGETIGPAAPGTPSRHSEPVTDVTGAGIRGETSDRTGELRIATAPAGPRNDKSAPGTPSRHSEGCAAARGNPSSAGASHREEARHD